MSARASMLPTGFLERLEAVLGPRGFTTDPAEIEAHVVDFFRQNRGRSGLLMRPGSTEEVAAVLRLCSEAGVAVVPQAGNTGLAAGGIPDDSGTQAVLSVQRLNRIRAVDAEGEALVAEAGCVLADIQAAAAEVDLLFPLSLGAEGSCRIGGNIASNAGGLNVLRYGMARNLVLGLEIVLADGRIWNGLRSLRKDNTGYDLKQIFIGSEGTLGVITAAVLRLCPRPRERQTAWLAVETPEAALALFRRLRARLGELISSFELIAGPGVALVEASFEDSRAPVDAGQPWHVLVEAAWSFEEGLLERMEAVLAEVLDEGLVLDGSVAQSEAQREAMWAMRERLSEAMAGVGAVLRHDVTVPLARIPDLIRTGAERFGAVIPGVRAIPFGHVGDGNLHYNLLQPEGMDREAFRALRIEVQGRLFDLVQEQGGSISAEHGIGRLKRDELARRKDPVELELMRALKRLLDPKNILNPGVIV